MGLYNKEMCTAADDHIFSIFYNHILAFLV